MSQASSIMQKEYFQIVEDLIRDDRSLIFRLPPKPEEPLPSDCCGCSCRPCIFDMYRDDLLDWGARCLAQLQPEKYPYLKLQKIRNSDSLEFGPSGAQHLSLDPSSYTTMEVVDMKAQSSDTFLFRIKLPDESKRLDVPLGSHPLHPLMKRTILTGKILTVIGLQGQEFRLVSQNGETITRQFTPIVFPDQIGSFNLLIKLYEHGKMSSILRNLKRGEKIDVRGPFGLFTYRPNEYSDVLIMASGTGIAPIFQLIQKVLSDPDEATRLRLLFSSRNYSSIHFREKFHEWRRYWNFTTCYFLNHDEGETKIPYGEDVKFHKIDNHVVEKELKKIERPEKCLILVCGANRFMKDMINHVTKSGVPAPVPQWYRAGTGCITKNKLKSMGVLTFMKHSCFSFTTIWLQVLQKKSRNGRNGCCLVCRTFSIIDKIRLELVTSIMENGTHCNIASNADTTTRLKPTTAATLSQETLLCRHPQATKK
uniref:Cytochrome-b5 reductase n=1 Tax=Romanomermis culicivorax TaxID=13658 RepID=A0A915INB6_ROMCU